MEEKTFREYADFLKEDQGKVKAEVVLVQRDYILSKEGEEGFKKVVDFMKENEVPLDLENIKSSEWVPDWKSSLMIVACKEVLEWTDEDVFEMGRFAPRASFFIKTIMQYIVSIDALFKSADDYWKKQQSFGSIVPVEINKEENYAIVRIEDFKTHPLICIYHKGYFTGVVSLSVKSQNLTVEETKCAHRGDEYDEFLIKW